MIKISTKAYEAEHGKAPKGYGLWTFESVDGDWSYSREGNYGEVSKESKKYYAKDAGTRFGELSVMP